MEIADLGRNYTEVVLTGGPAAGKSSALSRLISALADDGVRALCVPEVATIVISGGFSDIERLAREDQDRYVEVQRQMTLIQSDLRQRYRALAQSFAPDPVCIIYDRAEMDAAAYLPEGKLERILADEGKTVAEVRDSYDCVVFLHSAATLGAHAYTTENNPARRESAEEAVTANKRTLAGWIGHPHLRIVEASDDLEAKLGRVVAVVRHALAIPAALEIERKFLLASAPDVSRLGVSRKIEILQTYLSSPEEGVERRVRRRAEAGAVLYHWTEKRRRGDGTTREEREALLTQREYERLLAETDPQAASLRKTRYCFAYRGHHFELDHFQRDGADDLWLLEVELVNPDEKVCLPPFLNVEREVTGEEAYLSAAIARGVS